MAKPTPSASKPRAHADALIGRLTSALATWDIEPEEVIGFELQPLRESKHPIERPEQRKNIPRT